MNRPAIIGTAGHIDHGKTLLIKMLTGVDTDRLKEERERGISIELGFASLTTPSGIRCGVIDVPGHERFIRNMLAGAGGIDVILLVIAADEGVMPQTREHLDIVDLLGAHTGIVALTKIDMVDPEWRELVIDDVRTYLERSCLAGAPIIPVSSVTREGREELLAALDRIVQAADLSPRGKFTRLPIDRVFTMQGFGTVVTGTLWAGRLREGDRVTILPDEEESRIKSLEVHGARVEEATAGQRVAVALHAMDREEITRGDWLVAGEPPPLASVLHARLRCVPNSPYAIKNRMRVHFYLGASEALGRVIPLEREEMKPGEEGLAEIRMEEPVLAERGDRFVLRSYSPMHTIAGGVILDVSGTRRKRFRDDDIRALRLAEEGTLEERIEAAVVGAGTMGLSEAELPGRFGQPPAEVQAAVGALIESGSLRRIGRGVVISADAAENAGGAIVEILREHQKKQALRWGLLKSELKSRLDKKVHPDMIEAWIQRGIEEGKVFVREDRLRYGENRIVLSPAHEATRGKIHGELAARGFSGPSVKEMLEAVGNPKDGEELLNHLIREGEIVKIPPDLLLEAARIEEMRRRVIDHFGHAGEMSVASLKDILGVSRKQGVPLLEWLDRQRWTERRGDVRVAGPMLHPPATP